VLRAGRARARIRPRTATARWWSRWVSQPARHGQEPVLQRRLDLTQAVHVDPRRDKPPVDVGDGLARCSRGQGDGPSGVGEDGARGDAGCSMSWAARAGSAQSTWTTPAPAPRISSSMGPWRITRPWSTIATASQVRCTSSSRCDDSTTVRPSPARPMIVSRISYMPAGWRPCPRPGRPGRPWPATARSAGPRRRPGPRPAGGGCPGRSGAGGSGARRRSRRPGRGPGCAAPGRGCQAATWCRRRRASARAACGSARS